MLGYLGPRGTYSETAARFFMDKIESEKPIEIQPIASISHVLDDVESGRVQMGVVPLENSLEGSVLVTLDRLATSPLLICAEVVLPIRHMVYGLKGTDFEKVERVYSHPQALAQCRNTLYQHFPHAEHVDYDSTAGAVQFVAKEKNPANVAIGSLDSGRDIELDVLISDAQDTTGNETRFALVCKADRIVSLYPEVLSSQQNTSEKTSILLALGDDHPGALYEVLRVFAEYDVNLSKLESRPTRKGLGSYHFYIDLIGDPHDLGTKEALERVQAIKGFSMKNIGSYPCFLLE